MQLILICTILFSAVMAFVLGFLSLRESRSLVNSTFSFFAFITSYWIITNPLMVFAPGEFWVRNSYAAGALVAPSALAWVIVLLHKKRSFVKLLIVYITATVFFVLAYTDFLIKHVERGLVGGFEGEFGPLFVIFSLYSVLILIIIIIELFIAFRKADSLWRLQLKYVIYGIYTFAFIAGFVDFILPIFGVKEFIPLDSPSSIIFVFCAYVSVVRYRFLDIRIFLRRIFVIGGAVTSSLVITLGLYYLNSVLNFPIAVGVLLPVALLIGIFLFSYFQKGFLKFANKYFFTTLYDRQRVTEEIAAKMSQTLVLDEILTIISLKLIHVLGVEQYAFATCEYTKNKACYLEQNSNINLKGIHKILSRQGVLDYFEKTSDVIVRDEIIHFTDDEALRPKKTTERDRQILLKFKNDLEDANIAVCVPMVSNNKLISLLLLGDKLSKDAYTVEDIQLLETISDQAAVAIQNASLYKASQEFNIKLRAEIEKATKDLSAANEHLKELDAAKSEFISIASHQLRTPLTGIMGYLSMMVAGDFGKIEPTQLKILQDVYGASNRLIRIVNIFLNVSRIEAGRFYLDYKKVSFESVVDEIIMELKPTATKRGIELVVDPSVKKIGEVMVDPDKMKDVMLNLVDNAIKYSQQGTITASAKKEGDQLHGFVHDQGVGIEPEEAKRLFSKFVRGTGIARVQPNGSGLGLFIAKKVVEEHGGKIWVESEGVGKGSTFQFVVPLKPSAAQLETQAKIASKVSKQKGKSAEDLKATAGT